MTIPSPRSMSPLTIPKRAREIPRSISSPKPLLPAIDFVPIDQAKGKRVSTQSMRPSFENPRPAPTPPKSSSRPNSFPNSLLMGIPESNLLEDSDGDVCEEAEDFLQFLSRAGFMAAERRTSSLRHSGSESRGSSRPVSGTSIPFDLHPPTPSSSCIVDSRRTSSLALRRESSVVVPPVLQQNFPTSSLEHESPLESPAMQREDNLTKVLSTLRMSSDFSLTTTSIAPTLAGDSAPFLARKSSSSDFSDLDVLLQKLGDPILNQLHQVYSLQFERMTQQIATLTRELAELKQSTLSSSIEQPFERMISLDVASTAPSEVSRSVSRQWSVAPGPRPPPPRSDEPPFWRVQLQKAGEDWDHGNTEMRKDSLRCVSPMTTH
jgi:hypothetical protein